MAPEPAEPAPRAPVDLLIRHAWLVTMDEERRIYRDGAIAIVGDRIWDVGPSAEVEARVSPRETIEGARFVITPGFVNCHIHVTGEPITRGYIPDDTDWRANVFDWLIPTYLAQSPEEERLSAQFAALEMLRTGTTCFIEAGTILDLAAVHDGLAEVGVRGRFGQAASASGCRTAPSRPARTRRRSPPRRSSRWSGSSIAIRCAAIRCSAPGRAWLATTPRLTTSGGRRR